jgi:hypothetical protein
VASCQLIGGLKQWQLGLAAVVLPLGDAAVIAGRLAEGCGPGMPPRRASSRSPTREVRELPKTNEILKLANANFAEAALDRHYKS